MANSPTNYAKAIGLVRIDAIVQTDDSIPETDYSHIIRYYGDAENRGKPSKSELDTAWLAYEDPNELAQEATPAELITMLTERVALLEQELEALKAT
jgi:hypothetical protein